MSITGLSARYKTNMADSTQPGVKVEELIQRLSTAVQNNDEKTRDEVDDVLKLEDQLNIRDRKAFKRAKRIQCLEAIRLRSLSLLQIMFSTDHVFVEYRREFMSCAIQADYLEGVKYFIDNGLKLESEPGDQKWLALFHAVEYGKPQIVDFLLKEQPNLVHSTLQGMTLVGMACKTRNFDTLKLLLNSTTTFDLNKVCGQPLALTPLQWCFENRSSPDLFNCVKILVENGADVNIQNSRNDQTPLIMAARDNFPDVVKYFMENGADLTSSDREKNTALHYLCHHPETQDSLDYIQRFVKQLENNKNLHILETKNSKGDTPLYLAVRSGNVQSVDILVEAGCDLNVKCGYDGSSTILSTAISTKKPRNPTGDIVTKLITAGSNVNCSDGSGRTPLMEAVNLKDLDSIKLLIQHGADINSKNCSGNSLLYYCWQPIPYYGTLKMDVHVLKLLKTVGARFKSEDLEEKGLERILLHDDADALEYLISNGLDIHHIGKNNRNILHLLPASTRIDNIKPYCNEADVNQQDTNGDTPLMCAANHQKLYSGPWLINYFLERDADVNLGNKKGQTPLMNVAVGDIIRPTILKLLVDAGADVNIRAQDGRTALQFLEPSYVYNCQYFDCLRLLLENGGSLSFDYKDLKGFTPIQYVLETGCVPLMWYLITQNCSFSSVSDRGKQFVFLHKYRGYLLKLARLFYHSGAPRQLILDIFKMDDVDKNKFKSFCGKLSLTELCRRQIRVSIGPSIQEKLQNLNIAPKLIRFICLMDLIPLKWFDINSIHVFVSSNSLLSL